MTDCKDCTTEQGRKDLINTPISIWSIYRAIEETYEIADATLDGKITKTATTEDGEKVQIPFTHKDGLEFVLDRLSVVLSDIDDLKRQIEVLAIHQEHKDDVNYLPLVD